MFEMGNKSCVYVYIYGVITPDFSSVMYQLLSSPTTANNGYYQTQNSQVYSVIIL